MERAFPAVKAAKQEKTTQRATRGAKVTAPSTTIAKQAQRSKATHVGVKDEPSHDRENVQEEALMVCCLLFVPSSCWNSCPIS